MAEIEQIAPFTAEEINVLTRASTDFVVFVNEVFSKSSRHFISGEHVDNTARFLAQNKRTMRVSARNHFKSYSFYAHAMWKIMFETPQKNVEAHYFSYSQDLAAYHIGKLKLAIASNPYFRHLIDKKTTAESVIRYTWDNVHFYTMEAHGLIQFKRGIHCLGPNEEVVVKNPKSGEIRKCAIQNLNRATSDDRLLFTEILTEQGFKRITDFFVRPNTDKLLDVTLLNGASMKITPDHPCLVQRHGKQLTVQASKLLKTDKIPYKPQYIENTAQQLGSYELGRFVGIYCGDGSIQGSKGLQFVNNPKKQTSMFLKTFAETHLGAQTRMIDYTTYERFFIAGKAAVELVSRYIKGNSSRTKHLCSDFLNMSSDFRRGFIAGYSESDGTNTTVASSSAQLIKDVSVVLNSLGLHYNMKRGKASSGFGIENRQMSVITASPTNQKRPSFKRVCIDKDDSEIFWMPISKIEKSNRIPDYVYDVRVDSETHLFSLANGIITHNCDYTYIDDPFQDPENELNPTIIHKINEIFKSNIMDMPNEPDGELHCTGTPQTDEDFYFDKNITGRFAVKILPAINEDGTALWPEWMDIPELEQKRIERTDRIFKREYLCSPVYSTESFFTREYLEQKSIDYNLISYKARLKYPKQGEIIAGFDIGKKAHPSHLAVFELRPDNKLVMIHQKWMDGWSYSNGKDFYETSPTQLEYLKMVITNFGIDRLYYDNTRGEFESFDEQGLLPRQMIPIVFSQKIKSVMASAFDKVVERAQLKIINEERLITQICSVTNNLQAIQTTKGHGDAFWSICLALLGVKDLSNYQEEGTAQHRKTVRVGVKSIFDNDAKIPDGF